MIFFYVILYIGPKTLFLHCFNDKSFPVFPIFAFHILTDAVPYDKLVLFFHGGVSMNNQNRTDSSSDKRQSLLTLCRFISIRITYRVMLTVVFLAGVIMAVSGRSLFAPFGIALLCLLLPSYINGAATKPTKKENSDTPLHSLYKRYRYSPIAFSSYRTALTLGLFLLFLWHVIQSEPILLFGISLPLLILALCLALSPVLSGVLFFCFHHRLMSGLL